MVVNHHDQVSRFFLLLIPNNTINTYKTAVYLYYSDRYTIIATGILSFYNIQHTYLMKKLYITTTYMWDIYVFMGPVLMLLLNIPGIPVGGRCNFCVCVCCLDSSHDPVNSIQRHPPSSKPCRCRY